MYSTFEEFGVAYIERGKISFQGVNELTLSPHYFSQTELLNEIQIQTMNRE
jgi:hypothetical protein